HSTTTYTSISSDYEEPSDVGFPRVVVYGYDRLPMHPPFPDYVPGPEPHLHLKRIHMFSLLTEMMMMRRSLLEMILMMRRRTRARMRRRRST
ncbi:hypothetical protein Tco_0196891, partial [Tanacetum coccineum]